MTNVMSFSGRLGAGAELRTTQNGDKVLGFRVANDLGYGERKTTQWVACAIWGNRAENLAPHLKRGSLVFLSGVVSVKTFRRANGETAACLDLRVSEVQLLDGARGEQRPQTRQEASKENSSTNRTRGSYGYAADGLPLDDEIPF